MAQQYSKQARSTLAQRVATTEETETQTPRSSRQTEPGLAWHNRDKAFQPTPAAILQMQRTVGNQAVMRYLATVRRQVAPATVQRFKVPLDTDFSRATLPESLQLQKISHESSEFKRHHIIPDTQLEKILEGSKQEAGEEDAKYYEVAADDWAKASLNQEIVRLNEAKTKKTAYDQADATKASAANLVALYNGSPQSNLLTKREVAQQAVDEFNTSQKSEAEAVVDLKYGLNKAEWGMFENPLVANADTSISTYNGVKGKVEGGTLLAADEAGDQLVPTMKWMPGNFVVGTGKRRFEPGNELDLEALVRHPDPEMRKKIAKFSIKQKLITQAELTKLEEDLQDTPNYTKWQQLVAEADSIDVQAVLTELATAKVPGKRQIVASTNGKEQKIKKNDGTWYNLLKKVVKS